MRIRGTTILIVLMMAAAMLIVISSVAAGPPVQRPDAASITLAGTVASKISYQGRLTDSAGNPLNGNYNLVFQLWDDATAGSQVGSDIAKNNVPVAEGLFTTDLDVQQLDFDGQALWLRVQVNGQWLSPRQELLPVPYALSLKPGAHVRSDSGSTAMGVSNLGGGLALQAYADGNIAVLGTSSQLVSLLPSGMIGVYGSGDDKGVYGEGMVGVGGESESAGGAGVHGTASGLDGKGVHGVADFGTGVLGTGETGVKGTSSVGAGVKGEGSVGVEGKGQFTEGVMGTSQSTYGVTGEGPLGGVKGTSTGGDGIEGHSQSGSGVFGISVSGEGVVGNSQTGIAVFGNSGGEAAIKGEGPKGVYGVSSADNGEGVHGNGTGSSTEGVLGTSTHGVGVWGVTSATWGLGTPQNLWVDGSCTGCTVAYVGQNGDTSTLEVGDVVSIIGIAPPLKGQQAPVLKVQRVTAAGGGFLGVVQARAAVEEVPAYASDATQAETIQMPGMATGNVAPGEHLFVVVQGLVQVRADTSAGAIQAGDPLGPVSTAGLAQKLDRRAAAPTLGRALEPLAKGTGLIWVLVLGQ
ncbi:MAG: hypothetical protein ACE5LU_19390 [Anaerolineae bacterium]